MSFPKTKKNKFVFNRGSYKSQCAYMLMLIRSKDMKAWLSFKNEFAGISEEDSYAFYEKLVAFYRGEKLVTQKEVELNPTAPIVNEKKKLAKNSLVNEKLENIKKKKEKKEEASNNVVELKKVEKKSPAKKAVKKVAKKKTAKKVTKRVSNKKVSKITKKKAA